MHIEPATAEQLDALIAGPDTFARRFDVGVADGFSSFPGVFEWSLEALRRGVPPEWSTHLFFDGDTLIGIGGFKGPPSGGAVEIGYELAPSHRGRGHATEAARQMIHAAGAAGVGIVRAHTLAGPNPSTAVLERLGFQHVEVIDDPDEGVTWRWHLELDRSMQPCR